MRHPVRGSLVSAVLLLIALSGCEFVTGSGAVGAIQLSVSGADAESRSIGPAMSVVAAYYDIRGAHAGSGETFERVSTESSLVIDGLAAGYWDVTIDAFNDTDVHLYTGTRRILVEGGVSLPVLFELAPIEGEGTLEISLSWPDGSLASPSVESSLVPSVGAALPLGFTISGSTASYANSAVQTGYHTLITKLKEGEEIVAGAVELVHIVNQQLTSAAFDFQNVNQPGGLEIGVEVTPAFSESYTVEIAGGEQSVSYGTDAVLSGSVVGNPGNTVFTWYVNGSAVDSGVTETTVSGLIPGHYRVDLIVISVDGSEGGSATTWVEIQGPGV